MFTQNSEIYSTTTNGTNHSKMTTGSGYGWFDYRYTAQTQGAVVGGTSSARTWTTQTSYSTQYGMTALIQGQRQYLWCVRNATSQQTLTEAQLRNYCMFYCNYYRVGIATPSPSYTLHVAGDIYTSGSYQPSDSRIKDNQQHYEKAKCLDVVSQMNVKSYTYNENAGHERDGKFAVGCIAQELINIPELHEAGVIDVIPKHKYKVKVGEEDSYDDEDNIVKQPILEERELNDFHVVNKEKLIPFLIGAIQEQQKMIDALKQQVDTLVM